MASLKKNPLLLFFMISFAVFNVLFFSHSWLVDTAYDHFDVYAQCLTDTTQVDSFGNCDFSKFTIVDDVVNTVYALSIVSTLISGSMLLSQQIERIWHKQRRSS
ncbi:MAG: hypothetical protein ACR2FM_04600 [Candidatus Saccharimonadales bacterium]